MLSYFDDDEKDDVKEVRLTCKNANTHGGTRLIFRMVDTVHDNDIVKEELISSENFSVYVRLPLFGICFIEANPI